ncbi:hypothetical protein PGT21_003984 [Puccinia graminis f. sp. tritici]|uniref:Uncharacterized protein n=2 Tax=Puccinia graminis f. sp. tritici TaxID=56615 RepID=A0A5B0Q4S6_PUCGR|nr:hypothetical protein PGT21_003984 [Puccinia graminis f. sp. tritici]
MYPYVLWNASLTQQSTSGSFILWLPPSEGPCGTAPLPSIKQNEHWFAEVSDGTESINLSWSKMPVGLPQLCSFLFGSYELASFWGPVFATGVRPSRPSLEEVSDIGSRYLKLADF